MRAGTVVETESRTGRSRYRVLLGLVPLALLLAAMRRARHRRQPNMRRHAQQESTSQAANRVRVQLRLPAGDNVEVRANKDTAFFAAP